MLSYWYRQRLWYMPPQNPPALYLTFDDGPIPGVTDWVLDILKKHEAKATFFCIGANIDKHPQVFKRLMAEGHTVGHHTQHHLKGWETAHIPFMEDYNLARKKVPHGLFRPPYGKITGQQARTIMQDNNKIVMWDVLPYDFRPNFSPQSCWQIVKKRARNGSIIVLHDSLKAEPRMKYTLEKTLGHFGSKGFKFLALPT